MKTLSFVKVHAAHREREQDPSPVDRVDDEGAVARQHRDALRPASGNVGQHQCLNEGARELRSTMRDEVDFQVTRCGIVPVTEGADRYRTADCRTLPGGPTPALAGGEPQRSKEPVDGGRTDRDQLGMQARVSLIRPCRSIAGSKAGIMTFRRLEQTRSETSQSVPRASHTAGPYRTLGRRSFGGVCGLDNKRMQCLR